MRSRGKRHRRWSGVDFRSPPTTAASSSASLLPAVFTALLSSQLNLHSPLPGTWELLVATCHSLGSSGSYRQRASCRAQFLCTPVSRTVTPHSSPLHFTLMKR